MYSKCIFVAITLAFFAGAIAEDTASADDSTKEKHEKFIFNDVKEKNLTLFTFDVKSINVKFSNEKNVSTFNSFNPKLDSQMLPVDLNVNSTSQDYTLYIGNNYSLSFSFVREGDFYNFSTIDLWQNNSKIFFWQDNPDLKLSKNIFKRETQGYKCGNLKITLKTDDTDPNSTTTAEIELVDFSFIAFQNSDHVKKPSFLECRQAPGSSIVPLAVGGALLVFMGIALVVYIFMRNRSS